MHNCLLYLSSVSFGDDGIFFLWRIMEFLSKYPNTAVCWSKIKKKNSDQQTAVFIKLVTCRTVMSYSIIFFRGSLRLLILSHVVTAMNDSAIEGYKCHLVDTSSIRSSRITVKTDTWSQQICKMLAKLGSEAHPRQNAELKIPSTPLNYSS